MSTCFFACRSLLRSMSFEGVYIYVCMCRRTQKSLSWMPKWALVMQVESQPPYKVLLGNKPNKKKKNQLEMPFFFLPSSFSDALAIIWVSTVLAIILRLPRVLFCASKVYVYVVLLLCSIRYSDWCKVISWYPRCRLEATLSTTFTSQPIRAPPPPPKKKMKTNKLQMRKSRWNDSAKRPSTDEEYDFISSHHKGRKDHPLLSSLFFLRQVNPW